MDSVEQQVLGASRGRSSPLRCGVLGAGAWGPGFANWEELTALLLAPEPAHAQDSAAQAAPKPAIIPANERRRAPLPVKMAVEVSCQALAASQLQGADVACVFGSGLGDTEITNYMCRALTTDSKQLSPTKFHNSVHNAAAGYWTISSGCMRSANSIAAFHQTAGVCLMEAMALCQLRREPVLITVFDCRAHDVYRELFLCDQQFAGALLICPEDMAVSRQWATLHSASMQPLAKDTQPELSTLRHAGLRALAEGNPAAKILGLLSAIAGLQADQRDLDLDLLLSVAPELAMSVRVQAPVAC